MKIYGVVVLYHPTEEIIQSINSYIGGVEKLYIVDNSENKNEKIINNIQMLSTKCIYVDNYGNQGIAHALNIGAKLAIENGADWLLTMDQDSHFENLEYNNFIKCIKTYKNINNIAVFAPNYIKSEEDYLDICSSNLCDTVITSGNIISLDKFTKIGNFDENLFIDEVDHDYCLRANELNYKVIKFSNIKLTHHLGEKKVGKFLIFTKEITSHSPIRHYYAMRNILYMFSKHKRNNKQWVRTRLLAVMKKMILALFFDDFKIKRSYFILQGALDYILNKNGKITSYDNKEK